MSRALFPKIRQIRHGHFFDVTGTFSMSRALFPKMSRAPQKMSRGKKNTSSVLRFLALAFSPEKECTSCPSRWPVYRGRFSGGTSLTASFLLSLHLFWRMRRCFLLWATLSLLVIANVVVLFEIIISLRRSFFLNCSLDPLSEKWFLQLYQPLWFFKVWSLRLQI